jgi:hypothetical protein
MLPRRRCEGEGSLLYKPGHLGTWLKQGDSIQAVHNSRHPYHISAALVPGRSHLKDQPLVEAKMGMCPVLRGLYMAQVLLTWLSQLGSQLST